MLGRGRYRHRRRTSAQLGRHIIGRYDPSRHHRRAARRLDSLPGVAGDSRGPFMRISTGLDGIQGAILRSAHAIWHVALPVIQLLSTFYPGKKS